MSDQPYEKPSVETIEKDGPIDTTPGLSEITNNGAIDSSVSW